MKISLMLIGDEILHNERKDTNACLVTSALKKKNLYLDKLLIVGDNENSIREGLLFLLGYSNILITSGGLGLTPDDITLSAVSKTLERPLIRNKTARTYASNSLKRIRKLTNKNYLDRLSYSIEGAIPLKNEVGVSPGMHIKINSKHIFVLPGVPTEFNVMFTQYVLPLLETEKKIFERTFLVPLRESDLIEFLEILEEKYSIKTASYPPVLGDTLLKIKLIGKKETIHEAAQHLKKFLKNKEVEFEEEVSK